MILRKLFQSLLHKLSNLFDSLPQYVFPESDFRGEITSTTFSKYIFSKGEVYFTMFVVIEQMGCFCCSSKYADRGI